MADPEQPDARTPLVLVVDDDEATRMLITRWLTKGGVTCIEARSGELGVEEAKKRANEIDAIVLDVMMPGIDGFEVIRRLKEDAVTQPIPVVMLTAHANDDASIVRGVESGVVDHLSKPFSGPVLSAKVRAVCERAMQARRIRLQLEFAERNATIDPLTTLFNRRNFDARLKEEAAHARRHERPFAVALLDLDHFKLVNDTYGHEQGDRVIVQFSSAIKAILREEDLAFRYGGEEFVLILRACVASSCTAVTDRLRDYLNSRAMDLGDGKMHVTAFSAGVASADRTNEFDSADIVSRADTALYAAKRAGRGRTNVA